MTEPRTHATAIATAIAASGARVADVEKAAGLRRGELQSYLTGSDIAARSLAAVSGLLGVSPVALSREEIR